MALDFVVAIGPYRSNSAGMRVMHRLCHLLNVVGARAAVTTDVVNPAWNTPTATDISPETVVIYPEVVAGNPLGARRVVRYVLNHPGLLGGESRYGDDEMVFYFMPRFRESAQAAAGEVIDDSRQLTLSVIEPDLFYHDRSRPRTYDCIFVGKGTHVRECVQIEGEDRMARVTPDYPTSRAETARLLQGCRTLYSYDDCSGLNNEALICGCQVLLVRDDGTTEVYEDAEGICARYVELYYDLEPVERFVGLVRERWCERPAPALCAG
jgi:hypothetical protein